MKKHYFAYGLSLEEEYMANQHPSARFYKFGCLRGFKLVFSSNGICSILKGSFGESVEGVIYEIEEVLDPPLENSKLIQMDVMGDSGGYVQAYVYLNQDKRFSPPSQEYLMRLQKKYLDYGFDLKAIENALDVSTYTNEKATRSAGKEIVCGSLPSL
jgi:hypothetical protein